jgi:hypothetical protein
MANEIPETKKIFVYTGAMQTYKAPWVTYGYMEVTPEQAQAGEWPKTSAYTFKRIIAKGFDAGAILEIPYAPNNENGLTVWGGAAKFLGFWKDPEKLAELQAISRAAQENKRAKQAAAKDKKLDALTPHIKALQKAYRQTQGATGRAAFLGWLIAQVTELP